MTAHNVCFKMGGGLWLYSGCEDELKTDRLVLVYGWDVITLNLTDVLYFKAQTFFFSRVAKINFSPSAKRWS